MPVEAFKMELHDQILDVVRTSTLTSCVKVFGATIDFGSNFQVKRFDEENPSGEAESQDDKLRALIKQQIQPTWINGIPVKSEGGTTEKEDLLAIGKEEIAKLKYKIATREMHPEASERLTGTFKRCTLLDLLMLKEEAKVYSSKSRITAWFIKNQKVDN